MKRSVLASGARASGGVGSSIGLAWAEIANAVKNLRAMMKLSCICDEVKNSGLDSWMILEQLDRLYTLEVRYERLSLLTTNKKLS